MIKRPRLKNAIAWLSFAIGFGSLGLLIAPGLLMASSESAWSRTWQPSPAGLAQDYSVISDSRVPNDIKMLFWLTPPMISEGPARKLLDTYVIIGVARGHISPGATFSFENVDALQALDQKSDSLRLLKGDDIPPALSGAVAVLTASFGQGMGVFGKGFHWFVFDAGSVKACSEGVLSIPFAGEVYTYKTPIPGCTPA